MKKMTERELGGIASREIAEAQGYDSDELSANRRFALQYYYGRPRGDEIEGRSTIQSLDVADQVNSIMAQLSPMMKSTLVEFEPSSEQDEDQAQLESDFVMHIADQSNAYTQFSYAAFDALLQSNGWVHVFPDEDVSIWETEHKQLDDLSLGEVMQASDPAEQVSIKSQKDEDGGLTSVVLEHKVIHKFCRVECVPPEYMLFSAGHLSQDLNECRFLAEKKLMTRSELLDMGYDKAKLDRLGTVDYETWEAATERARSYDDKRSGEEPSTEVVDIYCCYMYVDFDGDGIAELRRVVMGGYDGAEVLENEPARFTPYCTGSALPMPHRLTGTSQYELIKPIQDAKTHVLRQWLDNQNVANNARVGAVEGEVNMDDLTSSRPGGVVRLRSADGLVPIAFNDVGPSCQAALQYLDHIRTERGGAALELGTGQMQVAASSATAAAAEYGHKEKMSAFYCRNIVETIVKGTFLLIHRTLRANYSEEMQAKMHGKWASTNPGEWPMRRNLRVLAGMSGAERTGKAAALAQNLQYQMMGMQAGLDGVLVNPDKIHATLSDWLRASDLQPVESYYVDPSSEEAAEVSKQKAEAAQQQAAKQENLEQRIIDQEQQLDRYKHDTQIEFDRWKELLNQQIEEMKVIGKAVNDAELESLKQEGATNAEENSTSGD